MTDASDPQVVEQRTVQRAIELVQWHAQHASLALYPPETTGPIADATYVLRWLRNRNTADRTFFLRDVQRASRRWSDGGAKRVERTLDELEARGWVEGRPSQPGPQGGRPTVLYQLSPHV